eukprot:gene5232-13693_t
MQQQQQRFDFLASIAEIVGGRGKGCGATGLHVYARKLHGGGAMRAGVMIAAALLCAAMAVSTAHEHAHDQGGHHDHDHDHGGDDGHIDHRKTMYSQEANAEAAEAAAPEDPPA